MEQRPRIERFCFAKLRDEEVAGREAIAAHVGAELAAVVGADRVSVGLPADDSAARWDLSIVIRADDLAAWQRIAAMPRVAAVLDDYLPARAAVVKAWTFAASSGRAGPGAGLGRSRSRRAGSTGRRSRAPARPRR